MGRSSGSPPPPGPGRTDAERPSPLQRGVHTPCLGRDERTVRSGRRASWAALLAVPPCHAGEEPPEGLAFEVAVESAAGRGARGRARCSRQAAGPRADPRARPRSFHLQRTSLREAGLKCGSSCMAAVGMEEALSTRSEWLFPWRWSLVSLHPTSAPSPLVRIPKVGAGERFQHGLKAVWRRWTLTGRVDTPSMQESG
jgi:hypothetical protein